MMKKSSKQTVLVTGASGFIAMHCILKLIEQGYHVRGTLRSPTRAPGLRQAFSKYTTNDERLEFCKADLTSDEGWDEAARGCTYILHVASPFPPGPPDHDDDLIRPAREGTLRVLRAAAAAGVKRVVLTSSIAAVSYGQPCGCNTVFTEDDWSPLDSDLNAYQKSKTLAEKAAWDYVNGLEGENALELAVINPGMVIGPILDADYSPSGEIIRKLMRCEYPGCPDLGWPMVDVRDVADAHVAAMTVPEAAGQRFCCCIETYTVQDIAKILRRKYGARGYKVPTIRLPNFIMRLAALRDPTVRLALKELGRHMQVSSARIRAVLNWKPRTLEDMVIAMADSMIEHGVV
jgi:nucleoside-diphosphate-sugar epimerase